MRALIPTLLLLLICAAPRAVAAREAGQPHGDIEVAVSLGPSAQSGHASATVRIHAPREVVWSLLTSCTEALKLMPGLIACDVLETAPDQSSQAHSPRSRLFLVFTEGHLRVSGELREPGATLDRTRIGRLRACSGVPGTCRATATIPSRITRLSWRPASGSPNGSFELRSDAICPKCCEHCVRARKSCSPREIKSGNRIRNPSRGAE